MILGHHDESNFSNPIDTSTMSEEEYENYFEYISNIDVRETEANELIEDYFRRTYKDTKAIIDINYDFFGNLQDVLIVNILGHSLSYIDMDYFAVIRNYVGENCLWNISYYSSEDYRRANNFVHDFNIKCYNLIKL